MSFQRGDMILARLPFTDMSGAKVRPALVVQCDRNNQRLDDVILALVTTVTHRAALEATQVLVDLATAEGSQSGLLHTSAVKCEHLITLHKGSVHRVIGRLPDSLMRRVNDSLKESLGIP